MQSPSLIEIVKGHHNPMTGRRPICMQWLQLIVRHKYTRHGGQVYQHYLLRARIRLQRWRGSYYITVITEIFVLLPILLLQIWSSYFNAIILHDLNFIESFIRSSMKYS